MSVLRQLVEELLDAKKPCPECEGEGWFLCGESEIPCPNCGGEGYVLKSDASLFFYILSKYK